MHNHVLKITYQDILSNILTDMKHGFLPDVLKFIQLNLTDSYLLTKLLELLGMEINVQETV